MIRIIQGFNIALFLDLVIVVPAVGYHICLNLPAAISQPGNSLIEMLCSLYMRWQKTMHKFSRGRVRRKDEDDMGVKQAPIWRQMDGHVYGRPALSLGPRTTWLSRIPPLPSFHVSFCSSFCCRTMQEMWRERMKEGGYEGNSKYGAMRRIHVSVS